MHRFNLIDNAKDSLLHAVSHIKVDSQISPGDWKRVIVDLAHVVELLLKERIRRVHPSLVYANVDKYPSASAYTVGAVLAVERVQKIAGVELSASDLTAIETTRAKRNEIEHYEFSVDQVTYKLIVGQLLGFILRFSEQHLDLSWRQLCVESKSWDVLLGYNDFYADLLATAEKRIEEDELGVFDCPECSNETFCIDDEECLVCGYRENVHRCSSCKDEFLPSSVEYEGAPLCRKCEWEDGWASVHCERY